MTSFAYIGSVSSGTMRPEDLIPRFLYVLGQLDKPAHDALVEEYEDVLDSDDPDAEQQDYALEALFDALDQCAPPYCYFGSHEGDGADYGFWISWDSLNEDTDNEFGPVVKVNAGDEWPNPLPDGAEFVLEVNDHGNATLLTATDEEVWSVV